MGKGKRNQLEKAEAMLRTVNDAPQEPQNQWWMPENLEERAELLSRQMVEALEPNLAEQLLYLDKRRMGKRQKLELNAQLLLSAAESPEYRKELAKWILMKPLEVMKLANQLQTKNVQVDENVRVQHAIVVPAEQTVEEWTRIHQQETLSSGEEDWTLGAGEFLVEAVRVEDAS